MTDPAHRRKGYAGRMMRLLHSKLSSNPADQEPTILEAERPEGNAFASFLWSDVGLYYQSLPSKSGVRWEPTKPTVAHIPIDEALLEQPFSEEVSYLEMEDIDRLVKLDVLATWQELSQGEFVVMYSAQEVEWFALRAEAYFSGFPPSSNRTD
jgi:hypothetical protein